MKGFLQKTRGAIIHPFLLSLYVFTTVLLVAIVLNLPLEQALVTFLFLVITPGIFLVIFYKLTGDWHRSGILSSLLIIFLFYYGSIYRELQSRDISGLQISLNYILFSVWCLIFGLFFLATLRSKLRMKRMITTYLNIVSILVFARPVYILIQSGSQLLNDPMRNWTPEMFEPIDGLNHLQKPEPFPPDIYYIIVDGYGRQDVLETLYHFDNTEFVTYLGNQGFYVAEKSNTNYILTHLSLASSLNLKYLDELNQFVDQFGKEASNPQPLKTLISSNAMMKILKNFGYKTVSFDSGFFYTEIPDAEIYYQSHLPINEFEEVFLSLTAATLLADYPENKVPLLTYQTHRSRINSLLDSLYEVPKLPGPKFVFVHLVVPHPPFVFDRAGNDVTPKRSYGLHDGPTFAGTREEYQAGYVDQVIYINSRLKELIPIFIEESESSPVIILQGDHGPRMLFQWNPSGFSCLQEPASILNAYYFPDGDYSQLYDSISPVNSFRIVLNKYFAGNLPLLADRTYLSSFIPPTNIFSFYDFSDVTIAMDKPCNP